MAEQFIDQIEVAKRWGISHRTLEHWRWARKGPAYFKLGRRVAYRLADIEIFERENMRSHSGAGSAASGRAA
jgi:predicted DNA-binding transcriptional regulator AlpA